MNYEIVYCEDKAVVGVKTRTSNSNPDMGRSIGELWQGFYEKGIYQSIADKKNGKSIGLYTNYEDGANGEYDVMVCCEVTSSKNSPDGVQTLTIPAGNYAKFVVTGDMHTVVTEFWTKLWSMDLDRRFSCDYEEYQNSDMENAEIHMYISLK